MGLCFIELISIFIPYLIVLKINFFFDTVKSLAYNFAILYLNVSREGLKPYPAFHVRL